MGRPSSRKYKLARWFQIGVLVLVPALLVAVALKPDAPAVAQQDSPERTPYGFLDLASGRSLTVQLTGGEPDYGATTIAVPGVGLFAPTAAAQVTATSATGVQISYSGDGEFDAAVIDTELVRNTRSSGQTVPVTIN